jgi:hypothetical protein
MSVVWAVIPLVSLGLASTLVFGYAAIKLRKPIHWGAAVIYLALFVLMAELSDAAEGSAMDIAFAVPLVLSWLGGTVHAFVIRPKVFSSRQYDRAISTARNRRELRQEARETARDASMAWELRIGRPDLPRDFDDGGLVDVNHAPATALAELLPGMTPELVERVVRVREQCGGFTSVEELSTLAELPPALTPRIDEYAIFIP